jgi:sugar (pentulose or hexulose) kinase
MKDRLLSIDLGTQSARAMIFSGDGNLLEISKCPFKTAYNSPKPGYAEQDPDFYFQQIVQACQKLFSKTSIPKDSIAAVSLTTQRGTVVNLDKNKEVLRPAIVWLDQRQSKKQYPMSLLWNTIFSLPVLNPFMTRVRREAESNWLWENQRKIWDKTAHYMLISGYLTYRLTGEISDSTACQVGYMPFDYKKHDWAGSGHWKWNALGVKEGTMSPLVHPGDVIGEISPSAAKETGIPAGLSVVAGASDKACEVLGSGCTDLNQACIGFGTTATINVNSKKYMEIVPLIPAYPSAIKGEYNLEIQTYRGFWMVTWFKEQFAQAEIKLACVKGVSAEKLLEDLASEVSPGSSGLILQPHWSPGTRFPGVEAKGSIIGFGSIHRKRHLYRALLEGLAYSMREGMGQISKKTSTDIEVLYICGGGSSSDLVMQITADIFNLKTTRARTPEASGLGAAMLAAIGAGFYQSTGDCVNNMCASGKSFEPNSDSAHIYDRLYTEVYLRQYQRLKPLYTAIRDITGYPE